MNVSQLIPGEGSDPAWYKPIVSVSELARLLGVSVKTIYEWVQKGRLDGAFRKRGKRLLIWRERALDKIFNGKEWN